MPRQSQVVQRTVYECIAPFAIWKNGVSVSYVPGPPGRVEEGDPILRTHGHAFAPVTVSPVEQATAAPGERRPVQIPAEMQGKTYRVPPEADPAVLNPTALEPTDLETKEANNG